MALAPIAPSYDVRALRGFLMTRLMEQAFDTVSALPDSVQDELASVLLQLAGVGQPPVVLDDAEAASLDESLAQAERGEFASDDAIRAIWGKHGL
jgi:predicted transcriptional regulator